MRLQERVLRAEILAARRGWAVKLAETRRRTAAFKTTIEGLHAVSSETPKSLDASKPDFGWITAAFNADSIGQTALKLDVDFDLLGKAEHAIRKFNGVLRSYIESFKYLGQGKTPPFRRPATKTRQDVCVALNEVLTELDRIDTALKTKPVAFATQPSRTGIMDSLTKFRNVARFTLRKLTGHTTEGGGAEKKFRSQSEGAS